jgi:hypothetical protein
VFAQNPCLAHRLVEKLPGAPDKWKALLVFCLAWPFPN